MEMGYFSNVLERHDSIWMPLLPESEISYPADGNDVCFQVEDDSFWFRHRNQCIQLCVDRYHDKADVLFDVGGGNGFVSAGLEAEGIKVCLVEPGFEGVMKAKARGIKNIVRSTFEDCSFKKETISSVGLFDVLEHIEDDLQFLQNVREKMKPGGHIFLTVPAFSLLWSANDIVAQHYRRYSLWSLETVLKSAGYSISYSSYIFSWLVLPILFFRSIPSRFGLIKVTNVRERTLKHHQAQYVQLNRLSSDFSQWECKKIGKGQKISFGSSCLIVGRKM